MTAKLDWTDVAREIDERGFALAPELLDAADCAALIAAYDEDRRFRKRVVMGRHAYGSGEYKYFDYPLPEPVARLRGALYPPLASIANAWNAALGVEERFPAAHADYLARCRAAGQDRATPLVLRYRAGDYNRLHQDLYGEMVFPLQVTVLLSRPHADFTGGEFVLTEQRPRMQSRASVVTLSRGEGVIFPVRERPARGTRGFHRAEMRHGVSTVLDGSRHTLGLIFHDAK